MKTVLQGLIGELTERKAFLENTDSISESLEVEYIISVCEKRLDHEKKQLSESFGMGMEVFAGEPVEYELDFEHYYNQYYNETYVYRCDICNDSGAVKTGEFEYSECPCVSDDKQTPLRLSAKEREQKNI